MREVPLQVVAICTWFIAGSFLSTFEAAIDTIFLSFLYDQVLIAQNVSIK